MSQPKFIFICGTPRSGGSVTLSSLDGHPDILAWPFEFIYYPFFWQVSENRRMASLQRLNERLLRDQFAQYMAKRLQHGDGIYAAGATTSSAATAVGAGNTTSAPAVAAAPKPSFSIGDFDYESFERELLSADDRMVAAEEYLAYVFEHLRRNVTQYRARNPRYLAILTTARGFDWSDADLYARSRLLFSYREPVESYASIKEKNLRGRDLRSFFRPAAKKGALFWMETYRRISELAAARRNDRNFMGVPLATMQQDPPAMMRRICRFLEIEPHAEIDRLTIFGSPYGGNANEGELNSGRIASRTSRPRIHLSEFERAAFESLGCYDFLRDSHGEIRRLPLGRALRLSWAAAFREFPADRIIRIGGLVRRTLGRISVFLGMFRIWTCLVNRERITRIIAPGNRSIEYSPLWPRPERRSPVQS